ncbi:MAG TPA: SDR family NAD(P)-dependent oxidoreductase [Solirubrobacterales bacterium]|jgi:NAD(P)-dependent dehydrogenase (short-subunit alcohol dehydrogenase family)|nr:SDR family NAD(P)-dependent oxidoreductase [Solirubrobacterales bacterium]
MRALDEQTILITGSTDGLGLELAKRLAGKSATLVVHGRDPQRLERALTAIGGAAHRDRLHGALADFSSLEHVRRLARDVDREFERLDVLVNNAGIAGPAERQESADGFELTLAVNYLSHFLLTLELLPRLRASAPARIVNVASIGQAPLDFDNVMLERRYDGFLAYRQSKLAQITFTFELAERLRADRVEDVTVNALHPATLMDTKMVREWFGRAHATVDEGVEALLRLVAGPDLEGVSGRYFNGLSESTAHEQAYDPEARRRLWELSERLCGLSSGAIG